MGYRFMRILLFFDLPVVTDIEKNAYRKFVKLLKKDGFYMLQESVYVKLAMDEQVVKSTKNKINSIIPNKGSVMILTITEKQFSSIEFMLGSNNTDVINSTERVVVL